MKNTKRKILVLIFILILGNIFLGIALFNTQRSLNNFVDKVQSNSHLSLNSSSSIQTRIERLEKLKSDTAEDSGDLYHRLMDDGDMGSAGFRLFILVASLRTNSVNENELNSMITEYQGLSVNISAFYSSHKEFKNIQAGDLDILIAEFKKYKLLMERVEKLTVQP